MQTSSIDAFERNQFLSAMARMEDHYQRRNAVYSSMKGQSDPMVTLAPDDMARNVWNPIVRVTVRYQTLLPAPSVSPFHLPLSLFFSLSLSLPSRPRAVIHSAVAHNRTCSAVNLSPIPSAAYVCQVNVPDHYERMDTGLEWRYEKWAATAFLKCSRLAATT